MLTTTGSASLNGESHYHGAFAVVITYDAREATAIAELGVHADRPLRLPPSGFSDSLNAPRSFRFRS